MGRKKRAAGPTFELVSNPSSSLNSDFPNKRAEKEESYPVKKYRCDSYYVSIEAFAKYTKAHRMLDAAYVRCRYGAIPPDKPFCFSTRVGGQDLGWGRGKTRDAAIDAACRAAFSLVQAHGYEEFTLDDDCLTSMPDPANFEPPPPPPPPPPPLPTGQPPVSTYPSGFPPGMAPPLPAAANVSLIPQPKVLSSNAPVASSLSSALVMDPSTTSLSLSMKQPQQEHVVLKGGLKLVFQPDPDNQEDTCMEERRAVQHRYQVMLHKAVVNRRLHAAAASAPTTVP